jgi:hypothetical protein
MMRNERLAKNQTEQNHKSAMYNFLFDDKFKEYTAQTYQLLNLERQSVAAPPLNRRGETYGT